MHPRYSKLVARASNDSQAYAETKSFWINLAKQKVQILCDKSKGEIWTIAKLKTKICKQFSSNLNNQPLNLSMKENSIPLTEEKKKKEQLVDVELENSPASREQTPNSSRCASPIAEVNKFSITLTPDSKITFNFTFNFLTIDSIVVDINKILKHLPNTTNDLNASQDLIF
ncbi:unnamed protein product [Trichogramma brassicae]|uniref:Uncharacterized protein n=1 Tax=Trichogramma brassicae TaxID=86971 RepID=A0A6H5I0H6_9HYME|nr:unnamed protein product [Trichogramma brassicae]